MIAIAISPWARSSDRQRIPGRYRAAVTAATNPPATNPAAADLLARWAEIEDLGAASSLLGWDQETHMPPAGAEGRGRVLGTLAGIAHQRLCAPELLDAIDRSEESADDDVTVGQAREARRLVQRARRVPEDLTRALAEATSRALGVWRAAREADDFAVFADDLERVLHLTRERAAALADGGNHYDALLDEYETGATAARLDELFAGLRADLVPLLRAVATSGVSVDESAARGTFPVDAQRGLGLEVTAAMGFDFDAGRLDASAHPFCSSLNDRDVRLTWRWDETDFRPALLGMMHEAGHGLYEQGLPQQWRRTPLGSAVSLGVHESQSRLWENLVGRSLPFWRWALPRFGAAFPAHPQTTAEAVWRSLNVVAPSLIRVEADEVTYNLHVLARFELEKALVGGDLAVDDLPGAWADTYAELLGIRPQTAAEGVLQDIHWSMGAFGYFPTYTIGNLVAAQLFEAATAELGDLDAAFEAGEFGGLLDWLRRNVHSEGRRRLPDELVDHATGRPLSSAPFVARVRSICEQQYGITAA